MRRLDFSFSILEGSHYEKKSGITKELHNRLLKIRF